ncbi:hypothetical protein EYF80_015349 [Liparis tanakae]|uniref:Uncharacterized protein n=1 Tax=Liparis tanakae TaxID=230148 RepID=A0A4Z2I942_9TELE|nr:hypothetical protein EYF80_015349 [Liparis tanakae]
MVVLNNGDIVPTRDPPTIGEYNATTTSGSDGCECEKDPSRRKHPPPVPRPPANQFNDQADNQITLEKRKIEGVGDGWREKEGARERLFLRNQPLTRGKTVN